MELLQTDERIALLERGGYRVVRDKDPVPRGVGCGMEGLPALYDHGIYKDKLCVGTFTHMGSVEIGFLFRQDSSTFPMHRLDLALYCEANGLDYGVPGLSKIRDALKKRTVRELSLLERIQELEKSNL